jgi:hypothetical protein
MVSNVCVFATNVSKKRLILKAIATCSSGKIFYLGEEVVVRKKIFPEKFLK